jgi:opacity protein-like surface antigen
VGTDIDGNDHGPGFQNTTWYWGYASSGSAQGNSMVLSSSSSPATGVSKDNSNDPQNGVEITYDHEFFRKNKWRFGLESAFGYTRISISDSRTLTAFVNRITDTFTIPGGVIVPPPGYHGTFEGPGAVIGADPSGHTTTMTTQTGDTIVGSRSLDANVFSIRVGPYVEYQLSERFSLLLGGGLYLVVGDSRFQFREQVTIVDPVTGFQSTETHSGSGSQTDFLVGGYVGMNVMYSLTKDVDLFVGAQLQSVGRDVTRSNGKEAILNMGKSVVVSIGASYSF